MTELPFADIIATLETLLQNALPSVLVTQELDLPTTEQCPAVIIVLRRATHIPKQIVGSIGAQDEVNITVELQCWEFNAESVGNAARARDVLAQSVVDVLRANVTIGGLVQWLRVGGIEFANQPSGDGGGIYAVATVAVVATSLA